MSAERVKHLSTRRIIKERLESAMLECGGKPALVARLRDRFGMSGDTARKQIDRALEGPVGAEIVTNILGVLGVSRADFESFLEPSHNGALRATDAVVESQLSYGFRLSAEVEPTRDGALDEIEGHGEVYVGGCLLMVQLANTTNRPLTVTAARLTVDWRSAPRPKTAERCAAYGDGAVPHRLFVDLFRDRFEGWWILSDGVRAAGGPRRFEPNSQNLLAVADGTRILFNIQPGGIEWVHAAVLPKEEGVFTVTLAAMAVNAEQDKAAKKIRPIKVMKGGWR